MDNYLITAIDIHKSYQTDGCITKVLQGVNLEISAGDSISIRGPSGSGKTTLLNMLGLLDYPTQGQVIIAGENSSTLSDRERTLLRRTHVAFVFQSYRLISTLTAVENVAIPLLPKARFSKIEKKAEELLEKVGLGDKLDRLPNQLSGGEQQRVAIARALITEPSVILADEPTGNLDEATSSEMAMLLQRVNMELGTALIVATHDQTIANICQRKLSIVCGCLKEPSLA